MKKSLIVAAITLVSAFGFSYANDNPNISKTVQQAFSQDFKSATNVQWVRTKAFDKATFSLNSQVLFAYYDPNGFLLAVSRNITSENLPVGLQAEIKSHYAAYWISDLFENAHHHETTYYITLENADRKLVLKSEDTGHWSVYQQLDKKVE